MAEGARARPGGAPRVTEPEVRHLVERLREAKEDTGLSFAALAARTSYSKSSWERYLNGKTLPPRDAVEALANLSGADPARALALWQLADRAWSGRDAPGESEEPTETGSIRPASEAQGTPGVPISRERNPHRGAVVLAAAGVLAAVFGAGAVAGAYGGGHEEAAPRPSSGPCRGESCTGRDAQQQDTDCWTDAGTRARLETAGRIVELRVSPTCRAAWGRITGFGTGDRVWVDTADGRRQERQVVVPGRYLYTLMTGIERPSEVRACFELADGSSGCTPWGR